MDVLVKTVRHSRIYNSVFIFVAVCGAAYLFWKSCITTIDEVDFKFIWLAGVVWANGGDPYSATYANTAQVIFEGLKTNVPQFWYYGPNWWPISRALAAFDLSTATLIWRLSIVALIFLGSLLFYRALPFFGYKISFIELAGFVGVISLMEPTANTITIGQTTAIVYVGLGALALGLAANRCYLIVIGVIVMLLKPQIGLVLLPSFFIFRAYRVAVITALLITCLMALPSLIGHDLMTVFREYVAQAAIHGKQPSNLPLETTGLRHLIFALAGLSISSLSTTAIAILVVTAGTLVLRSGIQNEGRMTTNAINAWFFFAISSLACIVSLHTYDLIFMAPLLLLSLGFGVRFQILTALGFAVIVRSGNLAHFFYPKTADEQLVISAALDTGSVVLIFCVGVANLFLKSRNLSQGREDSQALSGV
jgi:hypothetical protein